MTEVAKRLREERKNRKVPQKIISELAGITERTYRKYEEDDSSLTVSTLRKLEPTGMDIFYIIFGKRSMNALTADEQAILEGYRAMSARERAGLLGMLAGMQSVDKSTQVKGKVGQHVEGNVNGHYVEGNASGHYAQGNVYNVHVEKKPS